MSLQTQLIEDMKSAMKAKERVKLDVIRFLRAAVKNWEIDNGEAKDDDVIKIINTQIKQVKEALEAFAQVGDERQNQEKEKLEILQSYLPAQMSDEDLKKIVETIINNSAIKQMGPIIGQVMAQVKNQADGSRASQMVKDLLSNAH